MAKKKKKKSSSGKGFGKVPEPTIPKPSNQQQEYVSNYPQDGPMGTGGLESVQGGTDKIPTFASTREIELDPNLPPEERTKILLREKYGMKTMQERAMENNLDQNRRRIRELKEMAEADENFDIMQVIPAPILVGIDRFLKGGLAIVTTLFIAAGAGITAEAWSAATGSPLPENVDQFIVGVVEPNFTPGLFVLLGFSVSLGIFASLQLGSEASQYKEDI